MVVTEDVEMIDEGLVGMEIELPLMNIGSRPYHGTQPGDVANRAIYLLTAGWSLGYNWMVKEATNAQIEVNSSPSSTIAGLHADLDQKLASLEDLCDQHNTIPGNPAIAPFAGSEYGAGAGALFVNKRIPEYWALIGKKKLNALTKFSGIHLHLDKWDDRQLEQYWLLTALDPISYAITATTPFTSEGVNGLNTHRIHTTRYLVFSDHPLGSQILDYPERLEEITDRNMENFTNWRNIMLSRGITKARFNKNFQPENTGYAHIRDRPSFGTWEIRSGDSAPLDLALAWAAVYKGIDNYARQSKVNIRIANEGENYSFSDQEFVLPNYATRKELERQTVLKGFNHPEPSVHKLLSDVLPYAMKGLPKSDRPYLAPAIEMLKTRKNLANYMMDNLRQNYGYLTGQRVSKPLARATNEFMRARYIDGIQRLKPLLSQGLGQGNTSYLMEKAA